MPSILKSPSPKKTNGRLEESENKEVGHIFSFFSGIAKIQGLPHIFLHEVLLDASSNPVALVIGFDKNFVEALFFDEDFDFKKPVFRSFKPFSIPVSENIIGRVINGLGQTEDALGSLPGKLTPIFSPAPQIIDRQPITEPLTTGIKVIDTNLPLGKGQRELIIGDRKLGKSTLAIDTVLSQKKAQPPVYCVYVMSGQKERQIRDLVSLFEKNNAFLYTTVVAAPAGASFAEQYLAPFVGCAIGEYFRDQGKDALIIYDDLSKHAKVYRDIALLLERAPGREAYPGDIFSLHAKLLERAAKLSEEKGGGSLTALPIIETQEGDISSFISTNIISITDGQIYLEQGLFQKGFLPAVNVGLSVSRVGSQAQPKILKEVIGSIRLTLAQHKELQKLSQLETVVSAQAKEKIHQGDLTLELLKQEKHTCVTWPEQVILFYATDEGLFDDIKKDSWNKFETLLLKLVKSRHSQVLKEIREGKFNEKTKQTIKKIIKDFKQKFTLV
ncbi:MAG TPA: F0F1 ATP synthase subunit alpha [Candidatus Moranbacteria bacterium]|nr:F0F1 ATP synthase subunit alpha [Candidatus Moranbacteria bacterium]